MGILEKNRLSRVLEYGLYALMLLGAVLTATLYWTIQDVTSQYPGAVGGFFEKYFIVLTVSGIMAELVLWQVAAIMRNIRQGNPFCKNTVTRLFTVGWESLVLSAFYFVMVFFIHKFFMVVVFVAFAVLGMVVFVVAQLFREAGNYKAENDMTI